MPTRRHRAKPGPLRKGSGARFPIASTVSQLQTTQFPGCVPIVTFFVMERTESPLVVVIGEVGWRQIEFIHILHFGPEAGVTIFQCDLYPLEWDSIREWRQFAYLAAFTITVGC